MMYCMMQWIKSLSLQKHVFYYKIIENRQQNKLVNMVNGNDLIKHNHWPSLYLT